MAKIVIAGGGISGLTIGFELLSKGINRENLILLEEKERTGGNIQSVKKGGFLIEAGPNGFLDNAPLTMQLIKRLEIEDRILKSNDEAGARFIYARNKIRKVPSTPLGLVTSGLLPLHGALRVFFEPFIKKGGFESESVFDFARRRIGRHAAETLISAMVSGVFAGDPVNLEMKAAFPKMVNMEQKYGGLVKAMLALKRQKKITGGPQGPSGRLTSFKDGFSELPKRLTQKLGSCIRTGSELIKAEQKGDRFILRIKGQSSIEADVVLLACPAWKSAAIVNGLDMELSMVLSKITFAPVTVVATGYNRDEIAHPLNGFGFLVPQNQNAKILGTLWTSSIWKNRAPDFRVLLRTMAGGALKPEVYKMEDDALYQMVTDDLEKILSIDIKPLYSRIFRFEKGIAQYKPGHTAQIRQIEAVLNKYPGLFISGSSYNGISVNHCVEEAPLVASKILNFLKR
jgi:oxygen-dependent protoporphyrinogen oxidase